MVDIFANILLRNLIPIFMEDGGACVCIFLSCIGFDIRLMLTLFGCPCLYRKISFIVTGCPFTEPCMCGTICVYRGMSHRIPCWHINCGLIRAGVITSVQGKLVRLSCGW